MKRQINLLMGEDDARALNALVLFLRESGATGRAASEGAAIRMAVRYAASHIPGAAMAPQSEGESDEGER